jgi:hypothetical protein
MVPTHPTDSVTNQRLIVVVPYRDREEHLRQLTSSLQTRLEGVDHKIAVIEQAGDDVFNKGRLLNAGFDLHRREEGAYFCFHDVDLLPEGAACSYSYPNQPTHLSKYCSQFNYRLPYSWLCGGVMLFSADDFRKINGYSNEYWGWGGEDDDLAMRLIHHGFTLGHREGRYTSLPHGRGWHQERAPAAHARNLERLRTSYSYADDGLCSLRYELLGVFEESQYTRYLVDVGSYPTEHEAELARPSLTRQREGVDAIDPKIALHEWREGRKLALAFAIVRNAAKTRAVAPR